MEAFVPQLLGIEDRAAADKTPAISVDAVEPLPQHADLAARNGDHDVRIKYDRDEHRRRQQDGQARQMAQNPPPTAPPPRLPVKHFRDLHHRPISIEPTISPSSSNVAR